MGWWADKLRAENPAVFNRGQQVPQTWLQQPAASPQQAAATPINQPRDEASASATPQSRRASDYLPPGSSSTQTCPRCGSDNYAAIKVDLSFGGRLPSGEQCFDCRYPFYNASGDMVPRGAVLSDAKQLGVKQRGNPKVGSWQGQATFDAAPLVV